MDRINRINRIDKIDKIDKIDRIDRGGGIVRRDYARFRPRGSRGAPSVCVRPALAIFASPDQVRGRLCGANPARSPRRSGARRLTSRPVFAMFGQ
jgi:hypothetical protein